MKQILKLKIIIFTAILLFSASSAFAAEALLEVKSSEIQIGSKFEAEFFLNTENENINAVEGKIVFPENLLELKEIRDGNSIINFWIERPKAKDGEIPFSGIIPGGYLGEKGLIFSVVFQPIQEGQGLIEIRDMKTLLNDGTGTETNTTISNLQLVISGQAPASQPAVVETKDIDIPESFKPMVASDSAIFDGKYFLVFVTQDKGSGIDHYEVREGREPFVVAESPYLLQDQNLHKKIAVKAVDRSGNERLVTLPPQKPLLWYENYIILAILIIMVFIAGVILRKGLWKKFIKSR